MKISLDHGWIWTAFTDHIRELAGRGRSLRVAALGPSRPFGQAAHHHWAGLV